MMKVKKQLIGMRRNIFVLWSCTRIGSFYGISNTKIFLTKSSGALYGRTFPLIHHRVLYENICSYYYFVPHNLAIGFSVNYSIIKIFAAAAKRSETFCSEYRQEHVQCYVTLCGLSVWIYLKVTCRNIS